MVIAAPIQATLHFKLTPALRSFSITTGNTPVAVAAFETPGRLIDARTGSENVPLPVSNDPVQ